MTFRFFIAASSLFISLIIHKSCFAKATDNLWLCPDASGIDNVISATTAPQGCTPYSAAQLKRSAVHPKQQVNTAPTHRGKLTVASAPPPGILPERPEPLDFTGINYVPLTDKPIVNPKLWRIQPHYRSDIKKIYLCHVDGQSQVIESLETPADQCTLMGAKASGSDAEKLHVKTIDGVVSSHTPIPEITLTIKPDTTATSVSVPPPPNVDKNIEESDVEKIFLCQSDDGKQSIVQGKRAPSSDCEFMGTKAQSSPSEKRNVPTGQQYNPAPSKPTQTSIIATSSSPGDIYQCQDSSGKTSFVNEESLGAYHNCRFFSRSFSAITQDLARSTGLSSSLTTAQTETSQCSGAGEVIINGKTYKYECATRSYDHTPGSSGGEIQLGDRHATIPAYTQDYLNTDGSCGGTITSENGRILHLEPTKDCPDRLKIVAAEIARTVRAGLNIRVGGAFLARQRKLSTQINRIAKEVGIDPYLVHAVISAESAYKPKAVSHAGARGLMQLMPATAARFHVTDSFHSGENIRGGATYLKWLLKKFNGNMELAIAGYNAGEGNVIKYGYKIPPFIETKAYVPKVMQYYSRYRHDPTLIGL